MSIPIEEPRREIRELVNPDTLEIFDDFFERNPSLPYNYIWPRNKSGWNYHKTVEWKLQKSCEWKLLTAQQKFQLAEDIVKKWGGIKMNSPKTIERYAVLADMPEPPSPLAGIATYSKIFAIADPEKYAIYDARVAAALNAVQLLYGKPDYQRVFFNYGKGRNKSISGEEGFEKRFPRDYLIKERRWQPIDKDNTYEMYIGLLLALRERRGEALHHFEMTLFANAEDLCLEAMGLPSISRGAVRRWSSCAKS
jgi:hypothetical protein